MLAREVGAAIARRVLGSTVIGGMLAASGIAIFLIPVTFYVVERLATGRKPVRPEKTVRPAAHRPQLRKGASRCCVAIAA
jgi:HAE1 family hydrophobic/amphiphilic exporter-1